MPTPGQTGGDTSQGPLEVGYLIFNNGKPQFTIAVEIAVGADDNIVDLWLQVQQNSPHASGPPPGEQALVDSAGATAASTGQNNSTRFHRIIIA